ncbi:DegT/DnrJ/EryC1/StrS family aminotransferase [Bacillus mobilis]|uniref:DegT/DnrJ/EryC1/StrS family aminotransferase n=1 Tax=Bacillus mobilis TaxID=2026190 RepID=UPI000A3016F6|nr:DegT/DnrJ/EryC1/StrS family aminotransferase [Bacillus mobilis]MCU5594423.1 DegT/DnrJ/EryC1/StrS family aminotransferase [Bacillus mobilis]MCU5739491.1 DegT/DnrJ/EryC1/StrS family aminotransferase [Bacillus mobilis]MCU9558180.1 DegT/DnrJ/EryC1/StrS family aminotransferase [Bacillus mobilis]SMD73015.1 dTDP-3-amino-3,6-dideoxy-alpha-D-galactopyranose transaminase [Bacillus mobilis]HDR7514045.1 DegT/DnrJ/EryC1/StrS family aminotransferase [Bacillus mobilis]
MNVPMLDLKEQYQGMREEILVALDEVMSSSRFILGDNVKKLEEDVAVYSNVGHGIGVGNGSDAIHIALQAAGVGAGDEVITTAFTFFATGGAIVRAGATPVYVDIDPVTFNIDPAKIESAVTEKTKAILPVHLYGQMADMHAIVEIAKKYNLAIIEDAAQAIGARIKGKSVGELGTAATYSFFPTKNLGAYGDGGMIVTNHDDVAEKSRVIRVHGSKPKYYHSVLGYNSRLDELQAAVLNIKFPHLDKWSELRREKAAIYTKLLSEELGDVVVTPVEREGNYHVFHQYTLRVKERDELQAYLKEQGVATMIYYPLPLHIQPVFKELGYKEGDLPEAEKAAKEALSLPMFPELKLEQQKYVVSKIVEFYKKK